MINFKGFPDVRGTYSGTISVTPDGNLELTYVSEPKENDLLFPVTVGAD